MNRVVIIIPDTNPNSSTFIVALREGLSKPKDFLYGGGIPSYSYYNGYILKPYFWDKIKQRFLKFDIKTHLFEKYLVKQNVRTIIAEYGVTSTIILESCKKLNIKLITHFHGFDAYEHKILENYGKKYKEVFEYSSAIISVSKHMTQQLKRLGADEQKIIYNPCAPNNVFYSVKPNFQSNNFISIGRLVDKKAPYYTILAFEKVVSVFPESRLIMIGDGPLFNTCINLSKHLGICNAIEFKGTQTQEQIIEHLSNAFCYVQHSIIALNGDSEGTPVAIFEASAAGLPIVSTKHAGIPDVQLENKTAFLVDEHDVGTMAEKMMILYQNRALAQKMGKAGRKHIKENYSMEEYVKSILDII